MLLVVLLFKIIICLFSNLGLLGEVSISHLSKLFVFWISGCLA